MLWNQPPMQGKLPHAPPQHYQRRQHHRNTHPPQPCLRFNSDSVSSHVLGKLSPVGAFRTHCAALPQACFKSCDPRCFLKPQRRQIAANNPLAKHPARQLFVLPSLQRMQMARRDLRLLADLLNRDLASFSLPSQLVTESFHSLRPALDYRKNAVCLPDCSKHRPGFFPSQSPWNQTGYASGSTQSAGLKPSRIGTSIITPLLSLGHDNLDSITSTGGSFNVSIPLLRQSKGISVH